MVKSNFNKPQSKHKFTEPEGKSKGILDDFAVRKNIASREGTVEKVPVNNSDITNKKYVDGFDAILEAAILSNEVDIINNTSAIALNTTHRNDNTQAHSDYLLNTGDTASGTYNFDNNTLVINSATHRVGIGTSTPAELFHVSATGKANAITVDDATGNVGIGIVPHPSTVGLSYQGVYFRHASDTGNFICGTGTAFNYVWLRGKSDMDYYWGTDVDTGKYIFRGSGDFIVKNGSVGIGTSSPDKLLDLGSATVKGEIRVTNNDYNTWVIQKRRSDNSQLIGIKEDNTVAGGGMGLITNNLTRISITSTGNVGIGTTTPTEKLDINSDAIRIRTAQTPASAGAAGTAGMICWDTNYIYVCTATNTWKRTAISTW